MLDLAGNLINIDGMIFEVKMENWAYLKCLEKMIDDDKDITKEDYGVYEGILADKKPPEKTKKQTKTYYNNLGRGQEVLFDPKEGTYTIGSKVYDSEAFNKLNLILHFLHHMVI